MTNGESRIEQALFEIIRNSPFFRSLIGYIQIDVVPGESPVEGAFGLITPSGGVRFYEENLHDLDIPRLVGTLQTIVLHKALRHEGRGSDKENKVAWQMATDIAAWRIQEEHIKWLHSQGAMLPQVPNVAALCRFLSETLGQRIDPDTMTEEEMYAFLDFGGVGKGASVDAKIAKIAKKMEETGETHDEWGNGESAPGTKESPQEWQTRLETALMQQEEAEQHSQNRGYDPANLKNLVERAGRSVVPWQVILMQFLTKDQSDYDFVKFDKRMAGRGEYWWPTLEEDDVLSGIFAVDTSGSTLGMLPQFMGELLSILSYYRTELTIVSCDAEVHTSTLATWREGIDMDEILKMLEGGGGTDFAPVFRWVKKEKRRPDFLLYITDGVCDFPTEDPGYPVIWAIMPHSGTLSEFEKIAKTIHFGTPIFIPKSEKQGVA